MINFIKCEAVLAKVLRGFPDNFIFNKDDVLEYIIEASEQMSFKKFSQERIFLANISNYLCDVPKNTNTILEIIKFKDDFLKEESPSSSTEEKKEEETSESDGISYIDKLKTEKEKQEAYTKEKENIILAGQKRRLEILKKIYETDFYEKNYDTKKYVFVCLAEKSLEGNYLSYKNNTLRYEIIGLSKKVIRFSFKNGLIAMVVNQTILDPDTGFPFLIDHISYLNSIEHYVKYKIAEKSLWAGDSVKNARDLMTMHLQLFEKEREKAKGDIMLPSMEELRLFFRNNESLLNNGDRLN